PAVEIAAMAAHISHRIGRRRTADHLAARNLHLALAGISLPLGVVMPIEQPLLVDLAPAEPDLQPEADIPAVGLQHENAGIAILGQPARERTARRAGTDDDVVVFGSGHRANRYLRSFPSKREPSVCDLGSPLTRGRTELNAVSHLGVLVSATFL